MIITFSDTLKIARWLERKEYGPFCDFLNSFEGKNILEKYINILKCWDLDVSNDISLVNDGKTIKVSLSYLIDVFSASLEDYKILEEDGLKIKVKIPSNFDYNEELFPIYQVLVNLEVSEMNLNLENSSLEERKEIIDNLPANFYNKILKMILGCKDFIVSMDNPSFNKSFNFITYDPLYFMEGMFLPYNSNYHRDVLFHLSKRIGGEVLMNSTILDIEYFIREFSEEQKQGVDNTPSL